MIVRLYAWPNKDRLELSVVSVDLDDRGRELCTTLVRCDIPVPVWMRDRGADIAYVAASEACRALAAGFIHEDP